MKRLIFLMLAGLLIVSTVKAFAPSEKKDFLGDWKFENPHAPYGYHQGTFSIQEKEDDLTGNLKFTDGYKVDLKNFVLTDGTLRFSMVVDSYDITITTTVEGDKLKGTALTPDGDLPFEAVKVKKEDQQP